MAAARAHKLVQTEDPKRKFNLTKGRHLAVLTSLYLYQLAGLVSVSDKELQTRNTICILYLGSGQCQDGDGSQVPASPSPLSTTLPRPRPCDDSQSIQ